MPGTPTLDTPGYDGGCAYLPGILFAAVLMALIIARSRHAR
jgi:hypothetical protein